MTSELKLTGALIRALRDVQSGRVSQIFDAKGNRFEGVTGTSPQSYRRLREAKLIDDVKGYTAGAYATRVRQKLTESGEWALSVSIGQSK